MCTSEALLFSKNDTQQKHYFIFLLTCVQQLLSCEYIKNQTFMQCNWTKLSTTITIRVYIMSDNMLAKNSVISSLPNSELGNFCDTILMHSGISPVTVISICLFSLQTLSRMSLLYRIHHLPTDLPSLCWG